jgi:hypothetical protein
VNRWHWRTVYGNLAQIGGVKITDPKVRSGHPVDYQEWPLLSTSDTVFTYHSVGRYIREQFPIRSKYEDG